MQINKYQKIKQEKLVKRLQIRILYLIYQIQSHQIQNLCLIKKYNKCLVKSNINI
ncbi:unnamed protein product [Paramecium sonneborni]|uniref:Uncharacterized protein n=1 Tax=Paramecium sonneborni TaxID=65129 RepID=A0A8S1PPL4_9CILI|nr:unnamed protein product [Paramecium sonneborni]